MLKKLQILFAFFFMFTLSATELKAQCAIQVTHDYVCNEIDPSFYQVNFSVTGGTPPYTILGDYSGLVAEGETISFLVADGLGYFFTVVDEEGCLVDIVVNDIVPCSKQESCETLIVDHVRNCETGEESVYEVIFSIAGGTPPYTVSGDYNGIIENANQTTSFLVADGTGYFFEVVDDIGCTFTVNAADLLPCIKDTEIELLSFVGETVATGNVLKWATASEKDNSYFTLAYSIDGITFENIATINATGNSFIAQQYTYTHERAVAGTTYYRLSATDIAGVTTVSGIVKIVRGELTQNIQLVSLGSNSQQQLSIWYQSSKEEWAYISLLDLNGRVVARQGQDVAVGGAMYHLDLPNLARGLYLVVVETPSGVASAKYMR